MSAERAEPGIAPFEFLRDLCGEEATREIEIPHGRVQIKLIEKGKAISVRIDRKGKIPETFLVNKQGVLLDEPGLGAGFAAQAVQKLTGLQ